MREYKNNSGLSSFFTFLAVNKFCIEIKALFFSIAFVKNSSEVTTIPFINFFALNSILLKEVKAHAWIDC
jgi:hypothetical protein